MHTALRRLLAAAAIAAVPTSAYSQSLLHLQVVSDGDMLEARTVDGLNFVTASAVSPDGKHVYTVGGVGMAAGDDDNAIAVFARGADGRLSFVEVKFDDTDGGAADGLAAARDVVVSPDGRHVYTAGRSEAEIGIFSRNASSGALAFIGVVQGSGGAQLGGVTSLAMTADGATLFAVASAEDALLAFSRDSASGQLVFEDIENQGIGGVTGLDRPLFVAVSPDAKHVYTAAGAERNFTGSDAVAAFAWDAPTRSLSFIASYTEGQAQGGNTIDGLHFASGVTVSPDGRHLYATGGIDVDGDKDWIAIFSRNPNSGELTWLDSIDVLRFCEFDILTEHETQAVVTPDNRRVFVTHAASALVGFLRDPVSGALTFVDGDCYFDGLFSDPISNGLNLPGKFSIDPSGKHIYATGIASDAISVFGEPPRIEPLGISGGQFMLRVTKLSAGLPSRIESGSDLVAWSEVHSFVPQNTTYDWSMTVDGGGQQFFRPVID